MSVCALDSYTPQVLHGITTVYLKSFFVLIWWKESSETSCSHLGPIADITPENQTKGAAIGLVGSIKVTTDNVLLTS